MCRKAQADLVHDNYWAARAGMFYYDYVRALVRGFAADADSLIDVGSGNGAYLEDFYWIGTRHALDWKTPYSSPPGDGNHSEFLHVQSGPRL